MRALDHPHSRLFPHPRPLNSEDVPGPDRVVFQQVVLGLSVKRALYTTADYDSKDVTVSRRVTSYQEI
jgi:hypothetical protein